MVGLLQRFHSGAPYSAIGSIDVRSGVVNPNGYYATPPSSVSYYFGTRGAYRLDAISSTDLTATVHLPLTGKAIVLRVAGRLRLLVSRVSSRHRGQRVESISRLDQHRASSRMLFRRR